MIEAAQVQSFLGMGTLGMCMLIYTRLAILEWKFKDFERRVSVLEKAKQAKGYTHGEVY